MDIVDLIDSHLSIRIVRGVTVNNANTNPIYNHLRFAGLYSFEDIVVLSAYNQPLSLSSDQLDRPVESCKIARAIVT